MPRVVASHYIIMRVIRNLLLVIVALWSITVNAQSLNLAKSYIRQGNYLEAAKQLRPLADGGNEEAQYLAAQLFFEGKGVTKSEQQGLKYATLAANQGFKDAAILMADYYQSKGNSAKAFHILEEYVSKLNAWANDLGVRYAEALIKGEGCEKDDVRGYQLMEQGQSVDSPGWKYLFAHARDYLTTMGRFNGVPDPVAYAVRGNNADALASKHAAYYMVKQASSAALQNSMIRDFGNLAKSGDAWAMYIIARLLENGVGIKTDPILAKGWYRKAMNSGCPLAKSEYDRMNARYWIGEEFRDGEKIYWVSDDGKNCKAVSAECRELDCGGARQWASQKKTILPTVEDLKMIVKARRKDGLKVAGCYWSGNYLNQFDDNCNLIRSYDINAIPPSLGHYHHAYLVYYMNK